jgi:hypothetical protein
MMNMFERCPTCERIHGINDGASPEGCIRALKGAVYQYEDTFNLLFHAGDFNTMKAILERRVRHLCSRGEVLKVRPHDDDRQMSSLLIAELVKLVEAEDGKAKAEELAAELREIVHGG